MKSFNLTSCTVLQLSQRINDSQVATSSLPIIHVKVIKAKIKNSSQRHPLSPPFSLLNFLHHHIVLQKMLKRQESSLSASRRQAVAGATPPPPETHHAKAIGCMSGIIQLFSKYHYSNRRLTFGQRLIYFSHTFFVTLFPCKLFPQFSHNCANFQPPRFQVKSKKSSGSRRRRHQLYQPPLMPPKPLHPHPNSTFPTPTD